MRIVAEPNKIVEIDEIEEIRFPISGVYCLIDPRNLSVRYVGQSEDLRRREFDWRSMFVRCKASQALLDWFDDLCRENCEPKFDILCVCKIEYLNFMEKFWYQKLNESHELFQGENLVGVFPRENDVLKKLRVVE